MKSKWIRYVTQATAGGINRLQHETNVNNIQKFGSCSVVDTSRLILTQIRSS